LTFQTLETEERDGINYDTGTYFEHNHVTSNSPRFSTLLNIAPHQT